MPNVNDIVWFKQHFGAAVQRHLAGTPLSLGLIVAIACQETGAIWSALRRQGLTIPAILALCVGDTLDADKGRRAFPRSKANLLAHPDGEAIFAMARQALVDLAAQVPAYRGAARRDHKFCRGFGMFQYDLQHVRTDPAYFRDRQWQDFEQTLGRCLAVLRAALQRLGWQDRQSLTDAELAAVAIAFNTGRYRPALGLKQGHFDGRRYYGEHIAGFIRLARTVPDPMPAAPMAGLS